MTWNKTSNLSPFTGGRVRFPARVMVEFETEEIVAFPIDDLDMPLYTIIRREEAHAFNALESKLENAAHEILFFVELLLVA